MSSKEYNFWQQLGLGRDKWKPPSSDVPAGRPRDMTRVGTTELVDWNAHDLTAEIANDPVRLPSSPVPWKGKASMEGRPAQAGSSRETVKVRTSHRWHGQNTYHIPKPVDRPLWVEDMPTGMTAQWFANLGHPTYDGHAIVCDTTGRCAELSGVWKNTGTIEAKKCGIWSPDGKLLEGREVIAANRQLLPLLLNRDDLEVPRYAHRLTITVRGDDRDPEHFPWLNDWIALDPNRVPAGLSPHAKVLADILVRFGAVIGDHGGTTNLSVISGAQWKGIDFGGWQPRLRDFVNVVSAA